MLRTLIGAFVALSLMSGVAAAQAPPPPPPPPPDGHLIVGLEILSVDVADRSVTGILHCVAPDKAGSKVSLDVDDAVPFDQFHPGTVVTVDVAPASPPVIIALLPPSCPVQPGTVAPMPPPPSGFMPVPPGGMPGPGGPGGPGFGPGGGPGGAPDLARGFLNRVWRFEGEADDFSDGVLSMTLSKILNLPKRFADQDDSLVDQDAIVLVSKKVRVYDGKKLVKERREAAELDAAEDVRVQGKLLPPSKWRKDDDDSPVQTIRAKKIYIVN